MKSTITYALLSTLIGVGIALFAGLLWWVAPATTTVLSVAPVLIAGFLLGFGLLFQASPMLRQMLLPLRQVYPDAFGKSLRGGLSAITVAVLGLFVQSIVTPTTASAQCSNNLLPNGSLETGTFAPSTVNDENGAPITTTLTTYGGSDAIFLPFSSAPTEGHPITGFKLNTGYWVDATTNGGLGAKDANRLLVIHSGTGAGRCIWPGGMGFAYTIGTCYRVGFWAAQFDPANMNVASSINFEVENAYGTNVAGGALANFNVAPSAINIADPNFLQYSFDLPASGPTAKKIDGTPYTGTGVVDWTTLNWQYFSFDFTPAIADPPLNLYLSTSASSQGVALDGWCSVECSAVCNNPSGVTLGQTAPTCTGGVANNNGIIQITAGSDITNFGISTAGAAAYDGPAYPATTFTGLPQTVSNSIPNAGGTYIVRVFNGAADCFVDQMVTVAAVCCLEVTATPSVCHGNGTPENAADDFINFSVNITNPLEASQYFTVTGTQNGNPIAINLSNGNAATAVNCGLNTPLRTPAGTAGQGPITLTVTDNVFGCSKMITIADPGTCAVSCTPGTPTMVMYSYATQVDVTELVNLPIVLPRFDEMGGARTLTSVKLDYEVGSTTIAVMENKAAQAQNFRADFLTDAFIDLNGATIASPSLMVSLPLTSIPAGILVPAQGAWPGDFTPPLPATQVPSTLGGMSPWLTNDKLQFGKDPRTDLRWVTNATGDPTDDDDMVFFPATTDTDLGSITYTAPGDLANFIGAGNVPLVVSTSSGASSVGGGGNVDLIQRTRAYAFGKVTYTYECAATCTNPSGVSFTQSPATCLGVNMPANNGSITLASVNNGTHFGISTINAAAYDGPATVAAATAITVPQVIKNSIPNTGGTFIVRIFNATDDCFIDVTVTAPTIGCDCPTPPCGGTTAVKN